MFFQTELNITLQPYNPYPFSCVKKISLAHNYVKTKFTAKAFTKTFSTTNSVNEIVAVACCCT